MEEITTFVNDYLKDAVGWTDNRWKKMEKENGNFDKESRFSWERMLNMEKSLIGMIPKYK